MMISCEKAVRICDKAQYKEASVWDILKLKFHIFICKACSNHSQKNNTLTSLCEKAKLVALSEEDKTKMKESIADVN
jgi:predicted metal-binding protein